MKKTAQDQAELLRQARKTLKKTNGELAEALGVSESLMLAWLAPKSSGKHRPMRQPARLLLAAILADAKRKK
jgi:DNA-binding transcriptional regulator YiaG